VPDPSDRPSGYAFHPRCPYATEKCQVEKPALVAIGPTRQVACHYPRNVVS
jgi:oligopeptide/dipeptide ABC transporter ATP-binding protein